MKRLLWLGLLFISASWLFFIPIFTTTDWKIGVLFLTLGILCHIFALWKDKPIQIDKKFILCLFPLLLSIFIIHYPYNIGIIILTIGFLSYIIARYLLNCQQANAVVKGISLAGLILTIQTAMFPFYTILVSHGHRINILSLDILSHIVAQVGNLFGLKTSVNNGIVFVQTFQQTYAFTTTWEKLGFYTWFNIFIGALIFFFLLYGKRKIILHTVLFFITSFLYLILRYISLIYLYNNTLELSIFWNPFYMMIGFLPFALLLMKILPLKDGGVYANRLKDFTLHRKHIIVIVLIFLFIFSTVGAFAFQDPGVKKSGRILIDEFHSDWEDTTRPLDKEWYGLLSTYNYYSWAEWLNYYYQVERNINDTLTPDLLEKYDILILKCPTNSYSNIEISSIIQFVERGGGLYLIGDHTDVFGMNTFLNQVSEQFGIKFKTDATYELGTGNMSIYKTDSMFTHPIVEHVEQLEFMTSCTLQAPINSENVVIGNRLISEPGTYSTENFFRESIASPESEYGLLLQVVALKYGKGRIVAFTDSTVFSSFSIFSDGYQSFTLGVIEYLNRINAYSYITSILSIIAVFTFLSIIFTIYLVMEKEKKAVILFLFLSIGLLSFSLAAPLFSYINQVSYPLPNAHSDHINVCFDQEHSDFKVSLKPIIGFYDEKDNYGTFYVWTQRVGCVPSLEETLEEAIKKGDVIVFINPIKPFDKEDIDSITFFVENGGKVLLMDSITNSGSTANDLIGNFGMWLHHNTLDHRLYHSFNDSIDNSTIVGNTSTPFLSITGGETILVNEKNETRVGVVEIFNETSGKTGEIVVFVDSYSFSDSMMGGLFIEPDEHQSSLYDTQFYIFEDILLKEN